MSIKLAIKFSFILFTMSAIRAYSQNEGSYRGPKELSLIYKQIDAVKLKMKVFYPDGYVNGKSYPAIIFFFGGGWKGGTMTQFEPQGIYLASRGMIAVTVDYRVLLRQHTTPLEAVKDAKSAIRYLRENSKKLGIDTGRIVASGGSAGGHLAAASDLTNADEANENLSISSRPNAVVLFNPVLNTGPDGYAYSLFKDTYLQLSPYHNIRKGAAPTTIMSGSADVIAKPNMLKAYQDKMLEMGNRCDLHFYEGQVHGFYKYTAGADNNYYYQTLKEMDKFLVSIGYIKEQRQNVVK